MCIRDSDRTLPKLLFDISEGQFQCLNFFRSHSSDDSTHTSPTASIRGSIFVRCMNVNRPHLPKSRAVEGSLPLSPVESLPFKMLVDTTCYSLTKDSETTDGVSEDKTQNYHLA